MDYLKELVFQNEQLTASAKIAEKSLAMLQNQIQVLEKENAFLQAQIIQFGIDVAASSGQKQPNQQLLNSPLAQNLPFTYYSYTLSVLLCIPHIVFIHDICLIEPEHNKNCEQSYAHYNYVQSSLHLKPHFLENWPGSIRCLCMR